MKMVSRSHGCGRARALVIFAFAPPVLSEEEKDAILEGFADWAEAAWHLGQLVL